MTDVLAYTNYGKVRGVYFDGVYRFLGIRYAKPPVGERRFMPPEKPDVSDVVVDAKEYALKCWQTDTPRIAHVFLAVSGVDRHRASHVHQIG